ncbi:hypothetical protein DPEC_G00218970 [Dallia pectoralis]|uniref:Uncharacterized protein n=1 Tax=Dallia pectoralis TaxID=75939 RepID=A0ACC2G3D1_DALPE|nr:hypothetical protein DPEC_G00218970 [Dallia pectoralis]
MDHIFTITPPGPFDFEPSSWPAWIKRFERFRMAPGLKEKDGAYQVNSLNYTMGDKADDILSALQLTDEKEEDFEELNPKLDLATAIVQVRQHEEVKRQQAVLRALDDHPPRIIRFRLRLLRFYFNIIHVPGKNLITADALSRVPLPAAASEAEQDLERECNAYLDSIVESLPATPTKLEQIKSAQASDETCKRLSRYITNGWPRHRRDVHEQLLPYWPNRSVLYEGRGLLMKGERLIIPECMRPDILQRLHQGHQGINKCLARARESVWWPGLTSAVKQMVERCVICAREAQTPVEPLLTTELPNRPWQRVAADLFQWQNGNYLVVIDYFSRYIEVCSLPGSTSAKQTIARLKAVFARYGCPEVLVTDNGLQFSCHDFAQFAQDYNFAHVTSSPRYPCSNGLNG